MVGISKPTKNGKKRVRFLYTQSSYWNLRMLVYDIRFEQLHRNERFYLHLQVEFFPVQKFASLFIGGPREFSTVISQSKLPYNL